MLLYMYPLKLTVMMYVTWPAYTCVCVHETERGGGREGERGGGNKREREKVSTKRLTFNLTLP